MENLPMTGGRRWFRSGSVAQLNVPTQAQTSPAPAQGSGQGPSRAHTAPAPTQGPAPSSAPPAQATAPRIPLSGLPSERAAAPPQPQPPLPQTQQAQANNIVKGTHASQQPAPPSPSPGTPPHPQPPPSPRPRTPSQPQPQPPPPPPRSTIMARPLTPQPPESPKPRTRTWTPTPTSESPRTRIPSPPTESPKVIKALPPPEPPINRQLQPIRAPPPYPEPEPKPEPKTANHKTASTQQGSSNGSVKTMADHINGKQQGSSSQSHIRARSPPPPPSPRRETLMINGEKKFITMAGENMGAYMELGSPIGQHINRKQHHGYVLQHQNKGIEPESEREPTNKNKGREKMSVTEGKPKVAVVNSNVQSVNNSVISRSSCTQQSPGVHATIISRHQPKHKGATHQ